MNKFKWKFQKKLNRQSSDQLLSLLGSSAVQESSTQEPYHELQKDIKKGVENKIDDLMDRLEDDMLSLKMAYETAPEKADVDRMFTVAEDIESEAKQLQKELNK